MCEGAGLGAATGGPAGRRDRLRLRGGHQGTGFTSPPTTGLRVQVPTRQAKTKCEYKI